MHPHKAPFPTNRPQLIAPDLDAIYNNPELPSYSDGDVANANKKKLIFYRILEDFQLMFRSPKAFPLLKFHIFNCFSKPKYL